MNDLKHLTELRQLLQDYTISEEGYQLLERVTFVPLVGVASSGRNTIIRELVKTGRYYFVVSDTTRHKRANDGVMEQDGVEYWFRDEETVLAEIKQGAFLEAAVIHNQQVSGISLRELEKAATEKKIATTDMEVQGVHNIMEAKAPAVPIFILPPSYDEWQKRLQIRGQMTSKELRNRMESAQKELSFALKQDYYHFIVNDDLATAVYVVDKIASGHESAKHAAEAQQVAQDMLDRLNASL